MRKFITFLLPLFLILTVNNKVLAEENSFTRTIHLYAGKKESSYIVEVPNRFTVSDDRSIFEIKVKGNLNDCILNIESAESICLFNGQSEKLDITLSKKELSNLDDNYSDKNTIHLIISSLSEGKENIEIPLRFSLKEDNE